jgi:hypothetical protein
MSNHIKIADRIKELSYTTGTGNFNLSGAANGFSTFSSALSYNDRTFYAITDGTRYEIGSGVYLSGISNPELKRFPLRSTNSNGLVNFPAGLKEVFVTYPATHAVYTSSGIHNYSFPRDKGVAIWVGGNTLNYDSSIIWDSGNKRLGILKAEPDCGIEVGGNGQQSSIKASGFLVGTSGVYFPYANTTFYQNASPIVYSGGRQLVHFEPNQLETTTGANQVFDVSGVVNQYLLLQKQDAGTVFAGPASGCTPPCSPGYPMFRQLVAEDFPPLFVVSGILVSASGALNNKINTVSGILTNNSNNINTGVTTVSGMLVSASGALNNGISTVSGMFVSGSGTLNNGITTVSGMFVSGSGALNNSITTVSGLLNSSSGVVENQIYDHSIYNLGTVSGTLSLNWGRDRTIQKATLNGFPTTFNTGTGWPTTDLSRDLLLRLSTNTSTSITWNIVGSNWYNKPSGTTLTSGEYMFVLRAFGSGIINGFYLGQNTGSL